MKIKRFTGRDITSVTNQIKEEFGLAAIILSQKELPPEEGPGIEITAGVKDEDMPGRGVQNQPGQAAAPPEPQAPSAPAAGSAPLPASPRPEPLPKPRTGPAAGLAAYRQAGRSAVEFGGVSRHDLDELAENLGQEIGELKELILDLAHRQSLSEKWRDRPELISLYRRLLETGLSAGPSRDLVELAAESAGAWGGEAADVLRRVVKTKLRLIDLSADPPKRLALVGPSGVGKTTALAHLAVYYRQRGLTPAAITLDTLRLGGAEQLTGYARILGLGVRVCQNHDEFREALELFEGSSDLVLIDTPGRGFYKDEGRQEMAAFFNLAQAQALLVVSAAMKEADLSAALAKARSFRETGLVITKFDETESLGSLAGFLLAQMPRLAFFSTGPKTSEDFFIASQDRLLDFWLGQN